MVHPLVWAVAGLGAFVGYKLVRKEIRRVTRELDQARQSLKKDEAKQIDRGVKLERDPETGKYRPSDDS